MSSENEQKNIEVTGAPTMTKEEKKILVKWYEQSEAYCGPSSLRILLTYFKKDFTELQLAKLCDTTVETGTEHEGMIQAVKQIGGYAFVKDEGTIEDLEYFTKEEGLPVIVGWFDEEDDHYSVVVNVTEKNIIMSDPAANEPERWIDREKFPRVWFDFVGKDNRTVSWGWYMVVSFDKLEPGRFKVKGGKYF